MKLKWTDQAIDDLANIGDFIALDSSNCAKIHVEKLIKKAKQIIKFPEADRIVPEYRNANLREMIVENYRIVYLLDKPKKMIFIITIFESHYLLSSKLKK